MSLADAFPGYCEHCGGVHEGECGVKAATEHILEGYTPRGMTARFECPNGDGDGIWEWGPRSQSFKCMKCGVLVHPRTGRVIGNEPMPDPSAQSPNSQGPLGGLARLFHVIKGGRAKT